jgi:hypothetical protein
MNNPTFPPCCAEVHGNDVEVCEEMTFTWQHGATPSFDDFKQGLLGWNFKMPVSPAAYQALASSSKLEELREAGDCAIVAKISAFLLYHSGTTGACL